jgi:3-oxoacyl-[acyl-carrier protein] reductase
MSKVILLTGSSKGIGKYLSEYFLDNGYIVAGCSRSDATITHKNYEHFTLDVTSEKDVVSMVRKVKKIYKRIDVLINNAGVASMNHFITTPSATAKKVMNINFFGTFLFTREVSKVMIRQKYGRVVNFTTVASAYSLEGEAVYSASKAAVENLTRTVSNELASLGITVNAIGPVPIETDLIKTVPKEKINKLLERQAIKRFGSFEDVKNVVEFYMDDKSDFITGQIMYLGGVYK